MYEYVKAESYPKYGEEYEPVSGVYQPLVSAEIKYFVQFLNKKCFKGLAQFSKQIFNFEFVWF